MLEHTAENRERITLLRAAAAQITKVRKAENEGVYSKRRGGIDYIDHLNGLSNAFAYTMTLGSNVVLDIGAGETFAAQDLARSQIGKGLHFIATGLVKPYFLHGSINEEDFVLTPAESLRGIPDNSVGCVLSVFSITYSHAPELVVENIDRVLVEGGIVKAALRPTINIENAEARSDSKILKDLDATNGSIFEQLFRERGYFTDLNPNNSSRDVLLAVKGSKADNHLAPNLLIYDKSGFLI